MIGAIKDIWYAVTSPECYRDFMNYKKRKLLLHILILVVVAGIITMGKPVVEFISYGGFETLLEEQIPEFTASEENGFWIAEPVEIDEYNFLVKADSEVVKEDITDLDGQYGSYDYVIVVDKEQVYMNLAGLQEFVARFDEIPGFYLTKDDVVAYAPLLNMACFWGVLAGIFADFIYYIMAAVVVSMLSGILATILRVRLNNRKLFKMAVYAGTFSYILLLVLTVIGKTVPNFTFFNYLITLGYMFFALKEYKESGIEELPPENFGGREDF